MGRLGEKERETACGPTQASATAVAGGPVGTPQGMEPARPRPVVALGHLPPIRASLFLHRLIGVSAPSP